MTKTFEPGEVAVLYLEPGARLFVCGERNPDYPHRVLEAQSDWSREHKQPKDGLGTADVHLIKVKDRDDAVALVAVLKYIKEVCRSEEYAARSRAEVASKKARGLYEVYETEDAE